jgi:predicted amidohydrolase YtcJ
VFVAKSFTAMHDARPRAQAIVVNDSQIFDVGSLEVVQAALTGSLALDRMLE